MYILHDLELAIYTENPEIGSNFADFIFILYNLDQHSTVYIVHLVTHSLQIFFEFRISKFQQHTRVDQ